MLIEKVHNGIYSQFRIPGIVVTEMGTLLAYYECRESNSDWARIDIKIIRSTDEGATWQTVALIKGEGNTLNNPVMFVKGDTLHFLFFKNYRILFHCISTDDGKTLSEPQEKHFDCAFFYNVAAVGPGHGIVHNGRMIVPIWFAQNEMVPSAHHPSIISTLYSDDGCQWYLGELIGKETLVNPSECALAVTADNKVIISIRNENSCHQRAFALSDNGFSNWQALHFDPKMPDPICMGSMCYENGTLYHINCESDTIRENLTVKISNDCFENFVRVFVDTPGGYSDIAVKDSNLYILYERDYKNGGLYFQKITSPM